MANYFNLTLDTTAPSGVTLKINGDAVRTTSPELSLAIGCTDSNTSGYKMKLWFRMTDGDETYDLISENAAPWEDYAASVTVNIEEMSGFVGCGSENTTITAYVLVRDDLYNTASVVSDSIIFYSGRPEVSITAVSPVRITTLKDSIPAVSKPFTCYSALSFTVSKTCSDVKVMIVGASENSGSDSTHDASSNILIPSAHSEIFKREDEEKIVLSSDSGLAASGITLSPGTEYGVIIGADDIASVGSSDGCYCIKVFAKETNAAWSI